MTEAAKQQTAEEYVRSRWEIVEECGSFEDLSPNIRILCGFMYEVKPTWSAAYAFTLEREEQIRQLECEIAGCRGTVANLSEMIAMRLDRGESDRVRFAVRALCSACRILAREQAALAELKRGMK